MNKVAFVFPGQGSQYIGMGKDILDCAKDIVDLTNEILGFDLRKLCLEGPEAKLNLAEFASPSILMLSYILFSFFKEKVKPDFLAGHSLGEFTAAVCSECISYQDGIRIVKKRAEIMQKSSKDGAMAAILGLKKDKIEEIIKDEKNVEIANINCPGQIVISGKKYAVEKIKDKFLDAGAKKVVFLNVSVPSHSSFMEEAFYEFFLFMKDIKFNDPKIPIITNIDAKIKSNGEDLKKALINQMKSTILWEDCVRNLISQGVDTFFEIGPKNVLTNLIKRIDSSVKRYNIEKKDDIIKW